MTKDEIIVQIQAKFGRIFKVFDDCQFKLSQFYYNPELMASVKHDDLTDALRWVKSVMDEPDTINMLEYYKNQTPTFWQSTFMFQDEDLNEYQVMTKLMAAVAKRLRSKDKHNCFRKKELNRMAKRGEK